MADYRSTLTGTQMDAALLDMAEHNSEAYAVGERNGIAVASDDVTYHNNARYYAQIASSQIVGDASSAVRWDTDQSEVLTDAQKAQARENINAASDSDVVKITAQTLTSAQQSQARANIMAGGTNPNLLDNGWWLRPINQRSAVSLPNNAYGIDRWKGENSSDATVTVTSDGLVFNPAGATANAWQPLEASLRAWMVGKKITVSILKGDGTIISGTDTYTSGTSTYFITRPQSGGVECFISPGGNLNCRAASSYTIAAIKMELGSVSTLANDAPPDYWQELDKCLYYFERITNSASSPITIGAGFADGVHNLYAPVRMHRKRAGIATISTSGTIYAGQQSSNIVVSSVSQYNSSPDGIITLLANAPSSFTSNGYYRLALGAGAHIDFSADL